MGSLKVIVNPCAATGHAAAPGKGLIDFILRDERGNRRKLRTVSRINPTRKVKVSQAFQQSIRLVIVEAQKVLVSLICLEKGLILPEQIGTKAGIGKRLCQSLRFIGETAATDVLEGGQITGLLRFL